MMQFKKTLLATSVAATFGAGMLTTSAAVAGPVSAGSYDLVVIVTPTTTTSYGKTIIKAGKDGAWNSSFTFGGGAPTASSEGMTDNSLKLNDADGIGVLSRDFGSGVVDTFAGKLGITVASGTGAITVNTFSKDTIFGTAGGNFAQEGGDLSKYFGAVNLTTGAVSLTTGDFATALGRLGAIDTGAAGQPCVVGFCGLAWNKDDVGPAQGFSTFTTGTASTDTTSINGAVLASIGDVNGDGLLDYAGVLVSGGDVGSAWGSFVGNDYYEVWNVRLLSSASPVVPIPAAVWLFGSGLLGLVGVARRRRA